jgi:hypothetical protein
LKVSEHLSEFHKAATKHHGEMVDAHTAAMGKAQDSSMTAFHKSAVASHEKMKDFHTDALEECQKATAASDLAKSNMLVPDNVRGIITHFPGVTAVPRAGQRPIEKSEVDPELEKIVSFDD